jgi:glycosidase
MIPAGRSQLNILTLPIIVVALWILASCGPDKTKDLPGRKAPVSSVKHPDWSKNSVIYEVNLRQYTPEGTFRAFEAHLPRLKKLGVDILWLMPVNPIGVVNRKGTLGSYYSVKNYLTVNPEFGTMEDFRHLVKSAHGMGFRVIIDWVANHSSWDNNLVYEHPRWYTLDSLGRMVSPFNWTDVADLNYDSTGLRKYMAESMKFWVKETDIDGFRCDVAGMVPTDFWDNVRAGLDRIKPVFMLAEAEQPDHHAKAFDMSYAWELHHLLNEIAQGKKKAEDIWSYFSKQDSLYPADAYRMNFITNHDENSWNGTEWDRMGKAVQACAVLTFTLPGMPLIYSGQETGNRKKLEFFEKDLIEWNDSSNQTPFYTRLIELKKEHRSLWNGNQGGDLQRMETGMDDSIFAFSRAKKGDRVIVLTNLSDEQVSFTPSGEGWNGKYENFFTGETTAMKEGEALVMKPWEYRILIGK